MHKRDFFIPDSYKVPQPQFRCVLVNSKAPLGLAVFTWLLSNWSLRCFSINHTPSRSMSSGRGEPRGSPAGRRKKSPRRELYLPPPQDQCEFLILAVRIEYHSKSKQCEEFKQRESASRRTSKSIEFRGDSSLDLWSLATSNPWSTDQLLLHFGSLEHWSDCHHCYSKIERIEDSKRDHQILLRRPSTHISFSSHLFSSSSILSEWVSHVIPVTSVPLLVLVVPTTVRRESSSWVVNQPTLVWEQREFTLSVSEVETSSTELWDSNRECQVMGMRCREPRLWDSDGGRICAMRRKKKAEKRCSLEPSISFDGLNPFL